MTTLFGENASKVEEVGMKVVPQGDRDIYEILQSMQLSGFKSIVVHKDNTADIIWYAKEE